MSSIEYELDAELSANLILAAFENVTNMPELRRKVAAGQLECCILKRSLILAPLQIVVSANKALLAEKYNHLRTKNRYTEMLFNLNLSKNISASLARFGIDDTETSILVAIVRKGVDVDGATKRILLQIKGDPVHVVGFCHADESTLGKVYKISDDERRVSNLMDSIVSRIASKDFISY